MRILIPGNRRQPARPKSQEGSILVDAIFGIMLVSILGTALLLTLGQSYMGMAWLDKGLTEDIQGLGQDYSQLW